MCFCKLELFYSSLYVCTISFFYSQEAKLRAIPLYTTIAIHNSNISTTIKYAYSSSGIQKCKSKLFNFGHQTHFTSCTTHRKFLIHFVSSCCCFMFYIHREEILHAHWMWMSAYLLHDIYTFCIVLIQPGTHGFSILWISFWNS